MKVSTSSEPIDSQNLKLQRQEVKIPQTTTGSDGEQSHSYFHPQVARAMYSIQRPWVKTCITS